MIDVDRWRQRARAARREVHALSLACRDPRTPWYAKAAAVVVVAYALSPIDLIPDFIPVLGYLDDLVLIPLGVALVVKLLPPEVLRQARRSAAAVAPRRSAAALVAALVIAAIWVAGVAAVVLALFRY